MIHVQNPSFEDFVITSPGGFTGGGLGLNGFGWTTTGPSAVGVFRPALIFFNEPVPDGDNTAYSHGAIISQVLSEVLAPHTNYTLAVEIGDANNTNFPGYKVQLLAGGVLLAEDNSTLSPGTGFFKRPSSRSMPCRATPIWINPLRSGSFL